LTYKEAFDFYFDNNYCINSHKRISFKTVDSDGLAVDEVRYGLASKGINHSKHISLLSKDPSTKVGAVIMDKNGIIYSTGYNGYPREFPDLDYNNREYKYPRVVHAEANAIVNMVRTGSRLPANPILFVSGAPPCNECAKLICQVGFKEVVFDAHSIFHPRHANQTLIALDLFKNCGVSIGCVEYVNMNRIMSEILKREGNK
jgi:deoxycytidylate deaminase